MAQALAVNSVSSSDLTWTACAVENGTCTASGSHVVRYGTSAAFTDKLVTDNVACANDVFGDPAVGVVKSCSATTGTWVACASENATCAFTGTTEVRYGANGSFAVAQFSAGASCSNRNFGDPVVGVVKSCSYLMPAAASTPVTTAADPCQQLPALPPLPTTSQLVTSFCVNGHCATPNDGIDATDALDAALNASANRTLVFPPGKYLISRSLRIKQPGVTLWGPGAIIHATNTDDQSIIVENDGAAIYSFTLTAVTDWRRSRAEDTRIAIYGPPSHPVVRNTIIRNNQIVNAGDPGTNLANSASGAGIFVNAADGFLVAGNTVARSLADGIHITGGARNGRVLGNTVRETGDDMIAMVSYAYPDPNANVAATISTDFARSVATYQDTNILVADNTLSGQYWGRGISVVGGSAITVRSNTLNNIPYAAAIYLDREPQSGTYGLDNIVVERNTISEVQTLSPPYDFQGKFASHSRTGHGAIEVGGAMFVDELAYPGMVANFGVNNLAIRNNTITSSATPGLRLGQGSGSNWTMGTRAVTGTTQLNGISFDGNTLSRIQSASAMQIMNASGISSCSGDTRDGSALAGGNVCGPVHAAVAPVGESLVCPPL